MNMSVDTVVRCLCWCCYSAEWLVCIHDLCACRVADYSYSNRCHSSSISILAMEFPRYKCRPINAFLCTEFYRRSNCIRQSGRVRNPPYFEYFFCDAIPLPDNPTNPPNNPLRSIPLFALRPSPVFRVDSKCRRILTRSATIENSRPQLSPSMRSSNCEIECQSNAWRNHCRRRRCYSVEHDRNWHCCAGVVWRPASVSL